MSVDETAKAILEHLKEGSVDFYSRPRDDFETGRSAYDATGFVPVDFSDLKAMAKLWLLREDIHLLLNMTILLCNEAKFSDTAEKCQALIVRIVDLDRLKALENGE